MLSRDAFEQITIEDFKDGRQEGHHGYDSDGDVENVKCDGHTDEGRTMVITKTCLYNFDPLKPIFYIVKLGFTGVYVIFLISAQKHILWVLVGTASPRRF